MDSAGLIREARKRAGLTQRELAERVGTTQSSIARWETGGAHPSADTLAEIVRACGLELRVTLVDADESDASLLDRTLRLTPEQRFDDLVRTVAFIRKARAAMAETVG